MVSPATLLLAFNAAAAPWQGACPSHGQGSQETTVVVRGAPVRDGLEVRLDDHPPQPLSMVGNHILCTSLRRPPSRTTHLIVADTRDGRDVWFDGLLPLPDARDNLLAFQYSDQQGSPELVRFAAQPVLHGVTLDGRVPVLVVFGWAFLVFGYVAALFLGARRGRRRAEERGPLAGADHDG